MPLSPQESDFAFHCILVQSNFLELLVGQTARNELKTGDRENNLLNWEDTHVKFMFNRMRVKPDLLYWLCQSFKNCWAPEYELASIKIIVVFSVFENTLEVLGA